MPRSLLIVIVLAAFASWAWRTHVEEADGERLAALVQAGDIRMISSETCGWCTAARRWMTERRSMTTPTLLRKSATGRFDALPRASSTRQREGSPGGAC